MTGTDAATNVSRRLPVLTFHDISDTRSPTAVSPGAFAGIMDALAAGGWRTLDLDGLLAGHRHGAWPARSFFLTFDDGFASVAEVALPALRRLGFSATVFVVSDWVGRTNDWPGQPDWVPRRPLLDWPDLASLAAEGIAIGAHSMSHPALTGMEPDSLSREVAGSLRTIEDRLGLAVETFAYPYGKTSTEIEALAGRTYRAAFGTQLAFATPRSRRMAFERIDAHYLTGSLARGLESAWVAGYLSLRRLGRGLKGR